MTTRRFNIPADFENSTKECAHCNVVQPLGEFHKNVASSDGLSSACRTCRKPAEDAYYEAHREEIIVRTTQWNRDNADRRKRYNDKWLSENLEEQKRRRAVAQYERYWSDPDKWREYHADSVWKNNLWKNFHLTIDDYLEMLAIQEYVCAMCYKECPSGRRLAVDHDHGCCDKMPTCGDCVRGLLCVSCNGGLGFLRDDIDILVNAITYLEFYRVKVAA